MGRPSCVVCMCGICACVCIRCTESNEINKVHGSGCENTGSGPVVESYVRVAMSSAAVSREAVVSWAGAQTWLQTTGRGDTEGFDSSSAAYFSEIVDTP